MGARRTFLALVLAAVSTAVAGEDPFEASRAQLTSVVELVTNRVHEIEALLLRSKRESTALRSSCIEEKLQQLREKQALAKTDASTFQGLRSDAIAQKKLMEHSRIVEVFSAALVNDARTCADSKSTQIRLEVQLGGSQDAPGTLPGIEPLPPPRYDRPPLASPF